MFDNKTAIKKTHKDIQKDVTMVTKPQPVHVCPHGHMTSGVGKRTKADFHKVALRPRHSPYPMLGVGQALDIILEHAPVGSAITMENIPGKELSSLKHEVVHLFELLEMQLVS